MATEVQGSERVPF